MKVARAGKSFFRVGADVGGTFTDLVLSGPGGRLATKKVPSTPRDFGQAVVEGLQTLLAEQGLAPEEVKEIIHGTTVATNAILEKKGARTGLLTTEGFRDVLEIRRLRLPELYNLLLRKPEPLVDRALRLEVAERVDADGTVARPLDRDQAAGAIEKLIQAGVQSVAICLLHAYANPEHEQVLAQMIEQQWPQLFVSLSSDVLPQIREYERTSTVVINAYVMPVVKSYVESLGQALVQRSFRAPLLIMQSNGGIMTAELAARKPAYIIESGPAAGVIASRHIARQLGLSHIITFDMGGTTAKASLIENSNPTWTSEFEVGAGISVGSRLVSGGGYALNLPVIDLSEVGAGGGSIVWLDSSNSPQVGPQSAGADPGPVCYGAGGEAPTVTDANVVLGYLNQDFLLGGEMPIDAGKACAALCAKIADPLGLDLMEAAYGVYELANSHMIRAVKAVSSQRGRDPRDFAMLAFGGGGPLHAAAMARALEIKEVVIPPSPGLFSAFGLLHAEVEHHLVHTFYCPLSKLSLDDLDRALTRLESEASDALKRQGYGAGRCRLSRWADLRYVGQSFELRVPLPDGRMDRDQVAAVAEAFGVEHKRTYGHRTNHPVEFVNLRVVARGVRDGEEGLTGASSPTPADRKRRERLAYFGPFGRHMTPVTWRSQLSPEFRQGPVIIEEYDSTIAVPPDCSVALDVNGNVRIRIAVI
ncbi:MAG: hydantoinase/oxoprolinase family protein [Acidobacteriota bacterium]